jgi:hypothetical protein
MSQNTNVRSIETGQNSSIWQELLYTHLTYMHIFCRIFLSKCWWQESDIWSQASYRYAILWEAFLGPIYAHFSSHFSQQILMTGIWYLVTRNQQTGSRSLTGQKTLPTKWGTYMKLVTKYQCWEKCDEKLAYMFNVYKNQQGRQTGSRNLMGTKTLDPRYGVPIWSLWPNIRFVSSIVAEKNVTKNVHILYVQCV